MRLYVNGIGTLGPGLIGWRETRAVLAGASPYRETARPEPTASILPPNERRRSSTIVRWAVHVAQEAIEQAQVNPREVATVFASSCGETGVLDRLCTALATPQRVISPTLFHHSVHNAAAGYWASPRAHSNRPQRWLAMILLSVPRYWRQPPMRISKKDLCSSWPMISLLPFHSI